MIALGTIAETSQQASQSAGGPGDRLKRLKVKMKGKKKVREMKRAMRQEVKSEEKKRKTLAEEAEKGIPSVGGKTESVESGKSTDVGKYANPVRYKIKQAFKKVRQKIEDVQNKMEQGRLVRKGVQEVEEGKSKKNALTECPGGFCGKPGKN